MPNTVSTLTLSVGYLVRLSGEQSAVHLHGQLGRSLQLEAAASRKDRLLFLLAKGRTNASVPGHSGHHQEVGVADPDLSAGAQSAGDPP
jgi:hypothetical protein